MGSSSAPEYKTTTTDTGLFGKATTSKDGSTFSPTSFQKQLVGITEANAGRALNEYLNPNYDSEAFHQADAYYQNKLNNTLQNDYLNGALSRNLLRGSTASDVMRGFAQDLANTEYERQQQYKADQLQNYQAAMLPYATIYDMSQGTQGLSNQLSNNVSNYNLAKYQAEQQANQAMMNGIVGGVSALGSLGTGVGYGAAGLKGTLTK